MSNIIRRGKLYRNILPDIKLQTSFNYFKQFSNYLSLQDYQKAINIHDITNNVDAKLPFLQSLNNFPLEYSYSLNNNSIKIFHYIGSLENLTIYQLMLVLSLLNKSRIYLNSTETKDLVKLQEKISKKIEQLFKSKQIDAIHAINLYGFQKFTQSQTNINIFNMALQKLQSLSYNILKAVLSKNTGILLKRYQDNWIKLRKFKHFITFILYDYKVLNNIKQSQLSIYNNISQMKLNLRGYNRIPLFIEQSLNQIKLLNLDDHKAYPIQFLRDMLYSFKYFPRGYKQQYFKIILKQIVKRLVKGDQILNLNQLPFNKLKKQEVQELIDLIIAKNKFMSFLVYIPLNSEIIQYFFIQKYIKLIQSQYFQFYEKCQSKQMISFAIASYILKLYYKQNKTKTLSIIDKLNKFFSYKRNFKVFPFSIVIYLLQLDSTYNISLIKNNILINVTFLRLNPNKMYNYYKMVNQMVITFVDSDVHQVIDILKKCLTLAMQESKNGKLEFTFNMLFYLLKSKNYKNYYKQITYSIFNSIDKEDLFFFIQQYRIFQFKDSNLSTKVLTLCLQAHPKFQILGKLIYAVGPLIFNKIIQENTRLMKKIQIIQYNINEQILMSFTLFEVIEIIKFSIFYYRYLPKIGNSVFILLLHYFKNNQIQRYQVKDLILFIQNATLLSSCLDKTFNTNDVIIDMLNILKSKFHKSLLLKIKDAQIKKILRINLLNNELNDVVDQLYSEIIINSNNDKIYIIGTILKLYSYKLCDLQTNKINKLIIIAQKMINQNYMNFIQFINSLSMNSNYLFGNQQRSKQICNILIKYLQNITIKQNFQILFQLLSSGVKLKNSSFVSKCLKNISLIKLQSYEIERILFILIFCYYPIEVKQIFNSCLLQISTSKNQQLIINQLLYKLLNHSKQSQLNYELLKQNIDIFQNFLITSIINEQKQDKKKKIYFERIIKHIWCLITLKIQSPNIDKYAKYLQQNINLFQFNQQFGFKGVGWYNINIIFKYIEVQDMPIQSSKKLFKKQNKKKNNIFSQKIMIQESQLKQLEIFMKQLKFQKKQQNKQNKNNWYELNSILNGINLPVCFMKEGQLFAGFLIKRKNFNSSDLSCKQIFLKNALQKLLKIKTQFFISKNLDQ